MLNISLTLISVHFNVKLGKEQLSKVEQPNVDVPADSKCQYKSAHIKLETDLFTIFSMSSADKGFFVS